MKKPSNINMLLEARVFIEYITSCMLSKYTSNITGDGHPVIVYPGFTAGDITTMHLRKFLTSLGYETYPWGLGVNLGPSEGVLEACVERIKEVHNSTGQKVSLVGHSLGGVYARELAKMCPNETRQVITLGTPFYGDLTQTDTLIAKLYEILGNNPEDLIGQYDLSTNPPVPTTSIYSKTDGIVPWHTSVGEESHRAQNVEVYSSHVGMVFNVHAIHVVADRLAEPLGAWRKYKPLI